MKEKKRNKMMKAVLAMAVAVGVMLPSAKVMAAEKFDPAFYAAAYPDVAAVLGTDANVLYNHYITCGMAEGRRAYAGAAGGETVDGIADTAAAIPGVSFPGIVPLKDLPHYNDLKDTMTDEEFAEVYNDLVPLMLMVKGLNPSEQVIFVDYLLTESYTSGEVVYSNAVPNFSNAYGFIYYGAADDSGCVRTAGLMFDMLGIEWEHAAIRYNAMILHHWCIVTVDGQRYILDPSMNIFMPEESKYDHPLWSLFEE